MSGPHDTLKQRSTDQQQTEQSAPDFDFDADFDADRSRRLANVHLRREAAKLASEPQGNEHQRSPTGRWQDAECNTCEATPGQATPAAQAAPHDIFGPSSARTPDPSHDSSTYKQPRPADEVETNWNAHVQTSAPRDPYQPRKIVVGAAPPPMPNTKVRSSPEAHHTTKSDPFGLNSGTVHVDPFHQEVRAGYWSAFRNATLHVDAIQHAVKPDLDHFFHAERNPELIGMRFDDGWKGDLLKLAEMQEVPKGGGAKVGDLFTDDGKIAATAADQRTIASAGAARKEGAGKMDDASLGTATADRRVYAAIAGVKKAAEELEKARKGVLVAQKAIELEWRQADAAAIRAEIASVKEDAASVAALITDLLPSRILAVASSMDFAGKGAKSKEFETTAGSIGSTLLTMLSAHRLATLSDQLAAADRAVTETRAAKLQAELAMAKSDARAAVEGMTQSREELIAALGERQRAYNAAGSEAAAIASGDNSSKEKVAGFIAAIPIVESVLAAVRSLAEKTRDYRPAYSREAGIGYGIALYHRNWEAMEFPIAIGELQHMHAYFGTLALEWEERLRGLLAVKKQITGARPGE